MWRLELFQSCVFVPINFRLDYIKQKNMSKLDKSLKNLNIKNAKVYEQNNEMVDKKLQLTLLLEDVVSNCQNYSLYVCGTQSEQEFTIAVALSDYKCVVYSVGESLSQITTLDYNLESIVGMKFSPTSNSILYIANKSGLITAYDLRANKQVAVFKENGDNGGRKCLASFDLNERLIVGGTEQTSGDVFILFWDIRKSGFKTGCEDSLLGAYWESHIDDITYLIFHPTKQNVLASGSTDGLINIFDLTQCSEDLALTSSLNTESSVDRLGWLSDDSLWCTTHTYNLQLWECETPWPYKTFARNCLAMSKDDDPDDCYLVRLHTTNLFGPLLLAGSSTVKGENLRLLSIKENRLQTCCEIMGNKQIVRESWMHEKSGSLVTVGEKNIVNVWRQTESPTQEI